MFSIYENPEALFSACARSCLVTVRSQRISQQKPPREQARSSQGSRAGTERAPSHRPSAACPGPAEVLGQGRLKGRGLPQQRPTTCPARACDRQLSSVGAREPHTPEPGSSSVTVSVGTGGGLLCLLRGPQHSWAGPWRVLKRPLDRRLVTRPLPSTAMKPNRPTQSCCSDEDFLLRKSSGGFRACHVGIA